MCVEGNGILSPEAVDLVLRADKLVGPYIADCDPASVDAWLNVRTLAYSMHQSEESSGEEEGDLPQPGSSVGKIRLPPNSPSKPREVDQMLEDNVGMDDGNETVSKAKVKRKIKAIGLIASPAKSQEMKKTTSSSKSAGKIPAKPGVDHEPFIAAMHSSWPKPVSQSFSLILSSTGLTCLSIQCERCEKNNLPCYGPPYDGDRPRDSSKCVRCFHVRVFCVGGEKPPAPGPKASAVPLRSKRSADVAMDVDVPGPVKAAKSTRLETAGSIHATSSAGSPPPTSPSIDLSSLPPRPRNRRLRITSSVPSLPLVGTSIPSSLPVPPTPPVPLSVSAAEAILLSIRRVRTRVNSFAAEVYQDLDDLEDRVREFRA